MLKKDSSISFKPEQKDIDLKKNENESVSLENLFGYIEKLIDHDTSNYGSSTNTEKLKTANNFLNLDNKSSKFSINSIKNDQSNLSYKKAFFVISEQVDDDVDISLKIKRETLVNKLMYNRDIKFEKRLSTDFKDEIMNSIFLTLSQESREKVYNETNSHYFDSYIGYNNEKYSKTEEMVRNEAILYLCEKLIRLDNFSLNAGKTHNHIQNEEALKSTKPIIKNSINEKKMSLDDSQNHAIISHNTITITQEKEVDEELDLEQLKFFENLVEEYNGHPIRDSISNLLNIVKLPNQMTNKEKNLLMKNLHNHLINLLEEEKSKFHFYLESQETIQTSRNVTPKKLDKVDNPFKDTYENQSIVEEEKQMKNSIDESVIKNKKIPFKQKFVYMNSGWGVSDPPQKKHKALITSGNYSNKNQEKNPSLKKNVNISSKNELKSNSKNKKSSEKKTLDSDSSGEWVLEKNIRNKKK